MFFHAHALVGLKATLPPLLKHIGVGAFFACQLTELVLPEGLTHISTDAFAACTQLRLVTMPS